MKEEFLAEVTRLRERLDLAEERLSSVEECDCPKSCRAEGGVVREDGASWTEEGCQICSCVVRITKFATLYNFIICV